MPNKETYRIILSGGGTGGHIFPAIAIANEFKRQRPNSEFLFVGANGKMEMEKVPASGYKIIGLWISGIKRSLSLSNLSFPFKLIFSLFKSRKIIRQFKPHLAVGTGGFASGPLLLAAQQEGIATAIQEQNAFPGITNKRLGKKALRAFVAYPEMEKYFPAKTIIQTGNPVRAEVFSNLPTKEEACAYFNLIPSKPIILSVGGSLGSATLNDCWKLGLNNLKAHNHQLIWQTGKLQYKEIVQEVGDHGDTIHITEFIKDMCMAYAAADVIVSRAGAIAISELALVGKPVILVPFPYAAEDHQTKNAMALVDANAAKIIKDQDATTTLVDSIIQLLNNPEERQELAANIKTLGKPDAAKEIVTELIALMEK